MVGTLGQSEGKNSHIAREVGAGEELEGRPRVRSKRRVVLDAVGGRRLEGKVRIRIRIIIKIKIKVKARDKSKDKDKE